MKWYLPGKLGQSWATGHVERWGTWVGYGGLLLEGTTFLRNYPQDNYSSTFKCFLVSLPRSCSLAVLYIFRTADYIPTWQTSDPEETGSWPAESLAQSCRDQHPDPF
ncbi:hypothetical protein ASPFODRAFT_556278 [Aspergillus luchuensis CBS 106.47]|uniref:Uncharacterized protein n=1 Tax=Aspergillus luchuensis (strain CBS 106.47) TaxID=1137211 RepID=A0A1M3SYS9_ASPLC|nr:hypothetical protein ASPFODRAFT_556278 [Aspergillus luchuensis CBS 106.47]